MEKAYNILGLNSNDTIESVKKKYKKMALKYHPDRNKNKSESEEKMKEINWAYKYVLSNQFEIGGENIYFQRFTSNLINKGN